MRGLTAALLTAAMAGACGGVAARPTPDTTDVAEALHAWSTLDAERAAQLGERAWVASGDRDAAEVAARAHLALGRWTQAERATRGAPDETLRRLRARAQIARGDFPAAAATLRPLVQRREPDPWAVSVEPAVAASEGYAVRGERSVLPLAPMPLPVVEVEVDAVRTLALVGTGVHLCVLDPRVRRQAGAIDELTLGTMRVAHVPHTVRSLDAVGEALGAPIGMVIGADLLMRLGAVLDGPGSTLTLSRGTSAPGTAPLLTLTGSFLAVEVERGSNRAWMTLDTSGLFPIALTEDGGAALGVPESDWQTQSGGAELTTADLTLAGLPSEGIPLVRGLLAPRYAEAIGAPVSGSIGWLLLSQLEMRFDHASRTVALSSPSGR